MPYMIRGQRQIAVVPPPTDFKILNLPALAIKQTIHHLEPMDLLNLCETSQKTTRTIQKFTKNHQILLEFHSGFDAYITITCNDYNSTVYDVFRGNRLNFFRTLNQSIITKINPKSISYCLDSWRFISPTMSMAGGGWNVERRNFSVEATEPFSFDILKCQSAGVLGHFLDSNPFNTPEDRLNFLVTIKNASWMVLNDLNLVLKCVMVKLEMIRLSCQELNTFLKIVLAGSYRIKSLEVSMSEDVDIEVITEGLGGIRDEMSYSIPRQDGMENGKLSFTENGLALDLTSN